VGELHRALAAQHEKAVAKYGLPDSEVESFQDYYEKTKPA
jgi:hypothetical protein